MKSLNKFASFVLTLMMLLSLKLKAQHVPQLTSEERKLVIDSVSSKLSANYIFPEVAKELVTNIKSKLKSGDYNHISDPQEFASTLTSEIRAISNDLHINITFDPARIAALDQIVTTEDSIAYRNRYLGDLRRNNFGFNEVKILDGNIGYLDLRSFSEVEFAGETAVSAMTFLGNTDVIIIDLRNNSGGTPDMLQLITSYLFGSDPVHLNDFYWRPSDRYSQTWTLPYVTGKRSPDTPVFILTSGSTFSAAEEFSYNLKHLERATLIGETTGGGAHIAGPVVATDRFVIRVPIGRAINPITKTNWEGTGVTPHFKTSAGDALDLAYKKALEMLLENSKEEHLQAYYKWPLTKLRIKTEPVVLEINQLKAFIGKYGPRLVTMDNGKLFYQRGSGKKSELIPISENEFMLKGSDTFRIRFLSDGESITAIQGLYRNGFTDKNAKGKD